MQATGQSRTRPISRNRERVSRTGLLCGRAAEVIGSASTGDFKVLAAETTKLGVRSSNLFGRATADEDGHYVFAVAL
jgi:hypothetical protein